MRIAERREKEMKKRKPRKFIKGTKEFNRRKTTQMFQKKAREEGTTFSPRRLSRSVGLFVGQVTDEISAKNLNTKDNHVVKTDSCSYRSKIARCCQCIGSQKPTNNEVVDKTIQT